MSIEQAVVDRLGGVTAVTDLLGTSPIRIHPANAAQKTVLPYVTYELLSTQREGILTGQTGLASTRIQLDVWGETALSCYNVAEQIRLALDAWLYATLGTTNTKEVQSIRIDNETTDYENPIDGTSQGIYRRTLDFVIHFTETAANPN